MDSIYNNGEIGNGGEVVLDEEYWLGQDLDDPEVQYQFGRRLYSGEDVQKNTELAIKYLRLAEEKGHEGAARFLIELQPGWAEIPEASRETLPELCMLAERNDSPESFEAQYQVAMFLLSTSGEEWAEDIDRYLRMAEKGGHGGAAYELYGRVDEPNEKVTHLMSAGETIPEAMLELGRVYALGLHGFAPNAVEAEERLAKAAEIGDGEIKLQVAFIYKYGLGAVTAKDGEGRLWAGRAKKSGVGDAFARYNAYEGSDEQL